MARTKILRCEEPSKKKGGKPCKSKNRVTMYKGRPVCLQHVRYLVTPKKSKKTTPVKSKKDAPVKSKKDSSNGVEAASEGVKTVITQLREAVKAESDGKNTAIDKLEEYVETLVTEKNLANMLFKEIRDKVTMNTEDLSQLKETLDKIDV